MHAILYGIVLQLADDRTEEREHLTAVHCLPNVPVRVIPGGSRRHLHDDCGRRTSSSGRHLPFLGYLAH